jgi:hypothetical protein
LSGISGYGKTSENEFPVSSIISKK